MNLENTNVSEKFDQTETQEEKEAFEAMIKANEDERKDCEQLESAYDLFCCVTGNSNGYNLEDFRNDPHTDMWLKIVDKTGYTK